MRHKVGILLENRFIDQEIIYYSHRFKEAGYEVVFLTRLWGQERLAFKGLELGMIMEVDHSFEMLDEKALKDYGAIIVPAGYVADYLLYSETPKTLSPAATFIASVMEDAAIVKGFICHALWLSAPIKSSFAQRQVTCHNNIISHVENAGMVYVDDDIHVDKDLITARTGGHFAPFAKSILDVLESKK